MNTDRPLILIVEDNPIQQKVMTFLAEKSNLEGVVVASGKEAIDELARRAYRLVLMDWRMIDMDGLECTRLIRKQERSWGRRTPIVAITAHAMTGDKETCIHAGMDDYLSKPFTLEQFRAMVYKWLSAPTAKLDNVEPMPLDTDPGPRRSAC